MHYFSHWHLGASLLKSCISVHSRNYEVYGPHLTVFSLLASCQSSINYKDWSWKKFKVFWSSLLQSRFAKKPEVHKESFTSLLMDDNRFIEETKPSSQLGSLKQGNSRLISSKPSKPIEDQRAVLRLKFAAVGPLFLPPFLQGILSVYTV